MTKEKLSDVNSSNKNPYVLKLKRDFKINMFLKKLNFFIFRMYGFWVLQFTLNCIPTLT